ncbi:MAG: FHA domain-containing protein, partial [Pseudomonadota bacterium]
QTCALRSLVNIELGLHAAVVTLVAQADGAGVERREVVVDCALDTLRSAWLKTIAEAFVQQSRFDPLHDADTEQRLLDRLGEWLRSAVRDDHVDLVIPSGGLDHRATVESIDLVNAAAPAWAALANAVRAMVAAGAPLALQFDSSAADLPGLTDYLAARTGGTVFLLPPDAAALGALARADAITAQGSTRLVTTLPWDQQAVAPPEADAVDDTLAPTHVLRDATAFALGARPLVIGAGDADEPNRVPLPASMAGVSQRHCTLQRQGQQIVVADHSRYGTFLNGNLISGSAVLQAGDVVRVGTPGAEFQLIRVVQPDAA